jgi:hypothetical protein
LPLVHPLSRFEPDIYYNDTYGMPSGASPTTYQRVPQVINMAVNAWMRTFLGGWGLRRGLFGVV